jgi:hypothetical protein
MPRTEAVKNAYNVMMDAKLALGVSTSIFLADLIVPSKDMVVYANDPLSTQATKAFQSASPTPEVTGNVVVDNGIQVATAGISLELARRTTSNRYLGGMALAAQALGCTANAIAERTGWLTPLEKAQPDVGFSSISIAWFMNALMHRADKANNIKTKRLWQAGAAAFAGSMTAGAYAVDDLGGKLDITSHAAGILVGVGAYIIQKQRSSHELTASPDTI